MSQFIYSVVVSHRAVTAVTRVQFPVEETNLFAHEDDDHLWRPPASKRNSLETNLFAHEDDDHLWRPQPAREIHL